MRETFLVSTTPAAPMIACEDPTFFDDAVIVIDEVHNVTRMMCRKMDKDLDPRKRRNEMKDGPLRGRNQAVHFFQVALVASSEVVQTHHMLIKLKQNFQQITANEAGHTRDQPGLRGGWKRL
jgi:hypothetical protein